MVGVAVASVSLAARPLRDAPRKRAYLEWLEDVTASLRADVWAGRRSDPESVGVAIATSRDAVVAVPGIATLATALIPAPVVPVASPGGTSIDVSSCSTSSCGGDGGSSGCGG
jgi:hypothetical protein